MVFRISIRYPDEKRCVAEVIIRCVPFSQQIVANGRNAYRLPVGAPHINGILCIRYRDYLRVSSGAGRGYQFR